MKENDAMFTLCKVACVGTCLAVVCNDMLTGLVRLSVWQTQCNVSCVAWSVRSMIMPLIISPCDDDDDERNRRIIISNHI